MLRSRFVTPGPRVLSSVLSIALGLALGTGGMTGEVSAASPAEATPKNPSAWLKKARAHWIRGEFRASGEAYEEALAAMTLRKQKADEGAQAVLLAVDAYWSAFDESVASEELGRAIAVAERWLALVADGAQASMKIDVQRVLARLKAVYEPLRRAEMAHAEGNEAAAAKDFDEAAAVLRVQDRSWRTWARLVATASEARLTVFEADPASGSTVELALASTQIGEALQARPQSDRSGLADVLTALRDRIAERRAQAEADRAPSPPPPEPVVTAVEPAPAVTSEPVFAPVVGYVLLPTGLVALAGGATLLALGIVASQRASQASDDLRGSPAYGRLSESERMRFDAALASYNDASERYAYGTIISGSALVAGGVAMTVIGALTVAQTRKRQRTTAHWQAAPLWSGRRGPIGLSLRAEF